MTIEDELMVFGYFYWEITDEVQKPKAKLIQ